MKYWFSAYTYIYYDFTYYVDAGQGTDLDVGIHAVIHKLLKDVSENPTLRISEGAQEQNKDILMDKYKPLLVETTSPREISEALFAGKVGSMRKMKVGDKIMLSDIQDAAGTTINAKGTIVIICGFK